MKLFLALLVTPICAVVAQESWQNALARMPVRATGTIGRSNAMEVLLGSFQSNRTVKAMIFTPSVADDFYLINRAKPALNLAGENCLALVSALTNSTAVRATFVSPFLVLHTGANDLRGTMSVKHLRTAEKLRGAFHLLNPFFLDRHWSRLQPELAQKLGLKVRPEASSEKAWHFGRHNLAGWNLTDWELLSAIELAGKTSLVVRNNRLDFSR